LNCAHCLLDQHKVHIDSMIKIEEILANKSPLEINNWPKDIQLKNLGQN